MSSHIFLPFTQDSLPLHESDPAKRGPEAIQQNIIHIESAESAEQLKNLDPEHKNERI